MEVDVDLFLCLLTMVTTSESATIETLTH